MNCVNRPTLNHASIRRTDRTKGHCTAETRRETRHDLSTLLSDQVLFSFFRSNFLQPFSFHGRPRVHVFPPSPKSSRADCIEVITCDGHIIAVTVDGDHVLFVSRVQVRAPLLLLYGLQGFLRLAFDFLLDAFGPCLPKLLHDIAEAVVDPDISLCRFFHAQGADGYATTAPAELSANQSSNALRAKGVTAWENLRLLVDLFVVPVLEAHAALGNFNSRHQIRESSLGLIGRRGPPRWQR
mmetsp:Transcript_16631/g.39896  ORF Transcript_16631/g.39896 Transcript_16631/m.39896 type:complete len:240 (+) Transcript_16631:1-720(+)